MRKNIGKIVSFLLLLGMPLTLGAQSRGILTNESEDPRGLPELTVCSQNLENLGSYAVTAQRLRGLTEEQYRDKRLGLAERVARAKCDVVAFQELLTRSVEDSEEFLASFAKDLRRVTNRIYMGKAGPSNDKNSRVGFFVARDRAKIVNSLSYARVELPKILTEQQPREFARGPYEVQLFVKGRGKDSSSRTVSLVTFHFKSKHGGQADPAALEFETYRMEMAEALRRVVENRHAQSFASGETLLVLLGDRNSNYDAASAAILEGRLRLSDFQGEAPCRLSKRGVPLCQSGLPTVQKLFSVLTLDPETFKLLGTFQYGKVYSWLDDILLPAESLPVARAHFGVEGNYASGVVYTPEAASDHGLVYVRLNW